MSRFTSFKGILSSFAKEAQITKSKFKSMGYSLPLTDNVIHTFKEKYIDDQNNDRW